MIFLLNISLSLNELQRRNLTNCYSDESELTLNLNTYTLMLKLIPTNEPKCKEIESTVFVNLTLHANDYICDNLTLLIRDFVYENTTELTFDLYKKSQRQPNIVNIDSVFCNADLSSDKYLQDIPDITFSFVTIYTHSDIIQFEVMLYNQVKVQISQCFEYVNVTITNDYKLELKVQPTLVCKNLMNKNGQAGSSPPSNSNNVITKIQFVFNEITIDLSSADLSTFIDNYNSLTNTVLTLTDGRIKQIAEADDVVARMKLTTVQNELSVDVFYKINFTKVTTPNFFSNSLFFADDRQFFFMYEADDTQVTSLNTNTFAEYEIKVILKNGGDYITYQQVVPKSKYDTQNRIWIIQCKKLFGYEREQCVSFYNQSLNNPDLQAFVSLVFYDEDGNFVIHKEQQLSIASDCIDNLEIVFVDRKYLKVYFTNNTDAYCRKKMNQTFVENSIIVADQSYPGSLSQLTLSTPFSGFNNVTFPHEGDIAKKRVMERGRHYHVILLFSRTGANQTQEKIAALSSSIFLEDNELIRDISVLLGTLPLTGCLVFSIYGMVRTMKRVKLIKKKKAKL